MELTYIYSMLFGYLFGAIPFGLVLCFIFGYGDIRKIGSGNIGATNVLRTGNKLLAFLTFALDTCKGVIPIVLAMVLFSDLFHIGLVGIGAVLGHNFPVWLKFKGGKGISTTFGTILMLSWMVGLASFVVWLSVFLVSRISSLSALVAALLAPALSIFLDQTYLPFIAFLSFLVFVRHHENIKRLAKGEESKMSFKKGAK